MPANDFIRPYNFDGAVRQLDTKDLLDIPDLTTLIGQMVNEAIIIAVGDITEGPTGPEGPQGPQGEPGPQGEEGPPGDPGPQGLQGDPGPAGADGDDGATGATGATGAAGATGATGLAGIVRVNHGATAGTARPHAGDPPVLWVGTVTPSNADATRDFGAGF